MSDLVIKSFNVEALPAYVRYESGGTKEVVLLEPLNDKPGSYKVTLRRDQFNHSGNATGNGAFKLELATGVKLKGLVTKTVPSTTREGEQSPEQIEFFLQEE